MRGFRIAINLFRFIREGATFGYVSRGCQIVSGRLSPFGKQRDDGLRFYWSAEVIALDLVAMAVAQESKLLVRLHAFGNDLHVQSLSE